MRSHSIQGGARLCLAALLACAIGRETAKAAAQPDALLYVGVGGSPGEIAIFPRVHSRTQIGRITAGINNPGALVTDQAGTLYVANANNAITAYPLGATSPSLTYTTGVSGPTYLAIGPDGSLYVSNTMSRTVEQFPPGSVTPSRTIPLPAGQSGIAVGRSGDLFVVVGTDIERFAPGATHGRSLGFSLPESGQDLALDRHGNFLVNLPDFSLSLYARAKPHAQIDTYGTLYGQTGRFTLLRDDDALYLTDTLFGRVVQIAYPASNFANVISSFPGALTGLAVTPRVRH